MERRSTHPRSTANPPARARNGKARSPGRRPAANSSATPPSIRGAVLYGKEDVRIETVTGPPLPVGAVRLSIHAALTCGTDLKVYKRGYHARMIVPPALFGHEMAGVISEIRPATRSKKMFGWKVGDRVVVANSAPFGECFYCKNNQANLCDDLLFLNGAYADSIVVPRRLVEKNLVRIKSATSFRAAALAEPLACVVQGMADAGVQRGQHLLVIGSGPIGLMFVALARHAGCQVTLAGRGANRLHKGRQLGAKNVIDVPDGMGLAEAVRAQVSDPFDVVIEAVGKSEVWEAAVKLVRKGGLVNFFGGCPSGTKVALDTALLHYSSLRLVASFHHTPETFRRALQFLETNVISADDFVDGACALEELPTLFRVMSQSNRAVKTLITVR